MLTITDQRFAQKPSSMGRRDFLRIGSLGGFSLPALVAARSQAAMDRSLFRDKSVVFLFLQGGPPQIETFDPKIDVASDNRSCTGEVRTNLPGVWFGGTLPRLAQRADRLAVVRSFATKDGSHNHLPILTGRHPSGAAMGAMCALGAGAFNPVSGVPMNTVVVPEAVQPGLKLGSPTATFGLPRIREQVAGAGRLGSQYKGMVLDGSRGQLSNFDLKLPRDRFVDRFNLMGKLDGLKHHLDGIGNVNAMNQLERQAYDLLRHSTGNKQLGLDCRWDGRAPES
ncbi:MAG: DUF1501 domain-containing protein, partial [Verrucomicrobiota bacterium]